MVDGSVEERILYDFADVGSIVIDKIAICFTQPVVPADPIHASQLDEQILLKVCLLETLEKLEYSSAVVDQLFHNAEQGPVIFVFELLSSA